jgi:hypothetical protein
MVMAIFLPFVRRTSEVDFKVLSNYRSLLRTQHTSSPLLRYMQRMGQDFIRPYARCQKTHIARILQEQKVSIIFNTSLTKIFEVGRWRFVLDLSASAVTL